MKKFLSLLLCFVMVVSVLAIAPFNAGAANGIDSKIDSMLKLLPSGSYFTYDRKACPHSKTDSCNNCKLSKILTRSDLKSLGYVSGTDYTESWTCVSFANFAFRYIYGKKFVSSNYSQVASGSFGQSVFSQAKKGDIISFHNNSGGFCHYAVYIGNANSTSATFYQANFGGTAQINYGSWSYADMKSYYGQNGTAKVFRANNYNQITGETHTTHSYDTYVYYWDSHPHYKCYKCSCGEVKENTNEKVVLDTCAYCLDEYKATLSTEKAIYGLGESVTVSWNNISGATHYNLWLFKKESDDTSYLVSRNDKLQGTSFTFSDLPEGTYYTYFQTYNSNFWTEDDTDWFHSRADEIEFEILDPATHNHTHQEYMYYWRDHPHYICYKCICGDIKENRDEKMVLDTCAYCIDEYKTTLSTDKSEYILGDAVTISWNGIYNATHYNLWLFKKESDGTSCLVSRNDKLQGTSFTFSDLPEGTYYTYFQTYNSNFWTEDDTDWFHSRADEIEFVVIDKSFDEQLLGDTDGDGNVSIMDATFIQRHLAQIIVIDEDRLTCADTDKDGEIFVMDATRIQRFIAQLIPQL